MVALVTQMLDLHARLAAEGIPHEKAALQRRIEITDRQIDALVYVLYGLTPEEITVVEGREGLDREVAKVTKITKREDRKGTRHVHPPCASCFASSRSKPRRRGAA